MVMQRRHREDALARQLETQDLENYRDRFDDENAANYDEKQFLFTTNRNDSKHSADRERAGIAHEHPRGMTIEPEKAETGADERRADNR